MLQALDLHSRLPSWEPYTPVSPVARIQSLPLGACPVGKAVFLESLKTGSRGLEGWAWPPSPSAKGASRGPVPGLSPGAAGFPDPRGGKRPARMREEAGWTLLSARRLRRVGSRRAGR